MKNLSQVKVLVLTAIIGLSIAGCETLMTREGVREAEQRQEVPLSRTTAVQKTAAENTNRFAEFEAEQRQLNGRVEVVENRMGQAALEREKQKKQNDELLADMQKKMQVMQDELAKLNDTIGSLATEMANIKTSSDGTGAAAGAHEPAGLFEQAEELFSKKEFKKAILDYQKFRDSKPKDKRVVTAIYKMGVCFQELGLKDEAKTFYQEVVSKYPSSVEAQKCKIRLKKLK